MSYFKSDENTVAVVDFVLNNLRGEAGVGLDAQLKILVEKANLDAFEALGFARSRERQAALLRLKGARKLDNFGVEHNRILSAVD